MTLLVKIKNKKAIRILEDLASMDIIEISEESKKSAISKKSKPKPKTLTHLASETSLAKSWENPIEDKAWQNL